MSLPVFNNINNVNKIIKKKIVIIGGGTAGASALAFLQNKLGHICDIIMLTSKSIPRVGVGEATVGNIHPFLEECGLNPDKTCLNDARGTVKYAVHLKDWYKKGHSYYTPIGNIGCDCYDYEYFNQSSEEYWLSWSAMALAAKNKSPYIKKEYLDKVDLPHKWNEYSFNVDAELLGNKLMEHGKKLGGQILDKEIKEVKIIDEDKIDYLITDDGERIDADFFIDCSGFKRLVPNACGYKPIQFKEIPNDRAWVTRIPYVNKKEELPYLSLVECQTMNAGWRWQIGLRDRIGTGYVFSTDYISEEDALQEFKDSFEGDRVKDDEFQLIKFETACYEKQAGINWITCGLSSGFVEPLEGTSIFFMHNNLVAFVSLIKENKLSRDVQMMHVGTTWSEVSTDVNEFFMWDKEQVNIYNDYTYDNFATTVDYIGAHYAFNKNNKSKYWDDWTEKRDQYIKISSEVMNYNQQHVFFSRPSYSLLAVGNEISKEIDGWDLPKFIIFERQREQYYNGGYGDPPDIRKMVADRKPIEVLYANRMVYGTIEYRKLLLDKFMTYAYDLTDEYEYITTKNEDSKFDYLQDANLIIVNLTGGQEPSAPV